MIDLDANATTRILPEVLDEMLPWLRDGYANPSGSYSAAKRVRGAIDEARERVAALIGAGAEEIVFTGSGTESINTALRSLDGLSGPGRAVVSAVEHSAVLRCVEGLERECLKVRVDAGGGLDLVDLAAAMEGAAFVSIMAANNESGVIQPLAEVVKIARECGLPVHSDSVQAAGKIQLNVKESEVDMISLSAHKFHGPKGVGALYVRGGLRFQPMLMGGGQESGRRSGTENTAGIVGMGAAALHAARYLADAAGSPVALMRDAFEKRLLEGSVGVTLNGDLSQRLKNTLHLSIEGCDAAGMLVLLDNAGVACSAGSACMTGKQKPSHVQLAMGISEARAKTSLRFSFSRLNTMDEALTAADTVVKAIAKLRSVQGPGVGPVVVYSR